MVITMLCGYVDTKPAQQQGLISLALRWFFKLRKETPLLRFLRIQRNTPVAFHLWRLEYV